MRSFWGGGAVSQFPQVKGLGLGEGAFLCFLDVSESEKGFAYEELWTRRARYDQVNRQHHLRIYTENGEMNRQA